MKRLALFVLAFSCVCNGQVLSKPSQRTVPISDASGLITMKDIYVQTNTQSQQLASMSTQIADIKESVTRIETAQTDSKKNMDAIRHDVDTQGVIASLFVYSVQTFFTILIAVCVTVPGTFFVQKVLNERFAKQPTPPPNPT